MSPASFYTHFPPPQKKNSYRHNWCLLSLELKIKMSLFVNFKLFWPHKQTNSSRAVKHHSDSDDVSKSHLPSCPVQLRVLERFHVWLCGAAKRKNAQVLNTLPIVQLQQRAETDCVESDELKKRKAEGNDECSAVRHYDKRRKLSSIWAQEVSEVDPSRHTLILKTPNTSMWITTKMQNTMTHTGSSVCLMNRHYHADESVRCLLSHLCFGNWMILHGEEGELLSTDTEEERQGDYVSACMMEINTLWSETSSAIQNSTFYPWK